MKHEVNETEEELKVKLHEFLTSVLDGRVW